MSNDKISLKLEEREVTGKKVAALRREGTVPGVVYGSGFDAISVSAPALIVEKMYRAAGKHHPVHLTIGGKRKIAMIKAVDVDPVKHKVRHVSFHAVKQNEPVEAEIPVVLVGEGESEAEKAGLVILKNIDSLQVKALPMDLPDALEVDITKLKEAGEKLTVADIKLPENVEFVEHHSGHGDEEEHSVTEQMIVSVWEPSALQAANDASGGDAEPGDEEAVQSEEGGDSDQESQADEDRPGGKLQDEPKQQTVDANKESTK